MEEPNETQTAAWVDRQVAALLSDAEWSPNTAGGLKRLRERRHAIRRRKLISAFATASALGAATGVMAFPSTRAYADRCVQACVAGTSQVGQYVLAKLGSGEAKRSTKHAERREAPDFSLPDAQGRTIRLSAFRGKAVVLNFWATWCNPCRIEIPWFVDFQQRYESRGFSVIGVSLDEDGWEAVRPFLVKQGVNYPIVMGGDQAAQLYGGLESLPVTLIVDRSGRVAATHVGLVSKSVYEKDIEAVLAEP